MKKLKGVKMKVGTKSILFGVHQFVIHPLFVFLGWLVVYRKFPRPHEIVAIIIHDWGYWGCSDVDGKEGEAHPRRTNMLLPYLFAPGEFRCKILLEVAGHSRFNAKAEGIVLSRLFRADKMATSLYPRWLYLLLGNLSGEIKEYISHGDAKYSDVPKASKGQVQWLIETQAHLALMGLHGENYGPVAKQLGTK